MRNPSIATLALARYLRAHISHLGFCRFRALDLLALPPCHPVSTPACCPLLAASCQLPVVAVFQQRTLSASWLPGFTHLPAVLNELV